jgi:microcystin degradation protein MlrC
VRVALRRALLLAAVLPALVGGGQSSAEADAPPAQRKLRIAMAHFSHETTTFLPEKVGIDGFRKPNLAGEGLISYDESEVEGFVKVVREYGGVDLVPLESPGPVIGGSSKGWITREAFEHYAGLMLRDLRAAAPVDAVYLALHGAAAVEGVPRPEAELARRVREIVGAKVPIAGTFDPHGNEDAEFLRHANFALAGKYFPHYDMQLQGERAARLLIRTARGDYKPTTASRMPGIVTPTVVQWTGQYPWINIVQRALAWEARRRDVYVSFFYGFPWSDVPDLGASFHVMTNGDQALADRIADDMSKYMWRLREDLFRTPIVKPGDAVAQALRATKERKVPIVLADYSDRAGDATHLLGEIVRQDLGGVLYASLRDERTLSALEKQGAKAGDAFDREVGGFAAPASGKPVRIRGKLVRFSAGEPNGDDWRNSKLAIVEFGRGNWLVIRPTLAQVTVPQEVERGNIDGSRFSTWVIKSRVHFREGFDDTGYAKTILLVDAPEPSLGTVQLDELTYRNVDLGKLYPYGSP